MITLENENSNFGIVTEEEDILCTFNDYYKVIKNPLKTAVLSFYGNNAKTYEFERYLAKIFSNVVPEYDEKMNEWLIEPFHINILHVYSYFNMPKHLGKAVSAGTPFFPSKAGYSALSLCIDKFLTEALESLLSNFLPRLASNPTSFYHFGSLLSKLNTLSPPSLYQIYDLSFAKSLDSTLPKFCKQEVALPILKKSSKVLLPAKKFLKSSNFASEDKPITFYQTFYQFNLNVGSQESLDFFTSLQECKNIEIFTTLFIRTLIDQK